MTQIATQAQTKTSDFQQIETTIGHYFDGMINHNADSFTKAFNPAASMKWLEENKYMEVNAVQALSDYVNANDTVKTKIRITSINIVSNAANAQLELEYETFTFVDFMHLLKENNEWKIVSKTYTTVPKTF